jgi:hypothetical protein
VVFGKKQFMSGDDGFVCGWVLESTTALRETSTLQPREDVPASRVDADRWACTACTYLHSSESEVYFLACACCGEPRANN